MVRVNILIVLYLSEYTAVFISFQSIADRTKRTDLPYLNSGSSVKHQLMSYPYTACL